MSTHQLTTPESVRAVIVNPDPVLRNLQITQSYHELAMALREVLGGDDLPWCTFAVWASKQAGSFIRNEEVPAALHRYLDLDPENARGSNRPNGSNGHGSNVRDGRSGLILWPPRALLRSHPFLAYAGMTVSDVAAHVAEGNRLVYTRLAPIFADFLILARSERRARTSRPTPLKIEAFLRDLARDPTTGEMLQRAFRHYYGALFEADDAVRAERIFLANALVGWHEQIRLQVAIDGALSAPIQRALRDPARRFSRWPLPGFVRRAGAGLFATLWRPAILSFEDEWKRLATECLMTLGLPNGGELALGEDLPPLVDGSMFPPALRRIEHVDAPDVLGALDRTPDTLRGTGADDWSRLEDRMNYIVDYFRSRQQSAGLLRPPFSPRQVEAIHEGRMPEGNL